MFRKIVSNLNFSPALVGQLGFYAKRLRREEATRRLGLVFTALALIVQSFAVFAPPEAANAASGADFVRGGVSSVSDFLRYYDRNSNNIKTIYNSLGIKRSEIAKAKYTVIGESSRYNWSMSSLYSHQQGQRTWDYGPGKVFYRPMRLTQEGGDRHPVFYSYSKTQGWFAIKKDCGNLITAHPPQHPKPAALCKDLNVASLSPVRFRFTAKATVKNGAKVKGYVYTVKDASGNVVKTLSSQSSKLSNQVNYDRTTPGIYTVTLTVRTTQGNKTDNDCRGTFTVAQKPAAVCTNLTASISDRTIVELSGNAAVSNGATINKYTFIVKKSSGAEVKRIVVTSTSTMAAADSFTLTSAGTYIATLTVSTSVGDRTSNDCAKHFTITKPEVCQYNPSLPPNSPDCQPCPENPEIWIKDEKCNAEIISTKSSTNMTQGNIDATKVTARANDKVSYTLSMENKGNTSETVTMSEALEDVLEYAKLVDMGGGSFNVNTKTLSWTDIKLAPGQKQSRTIAVQLLATIPATNTGTSNEASYDCIMTNTFGNSVAINVDCRPEKVIVEQVVKDLPHTGPRENMIFAGALLSVVVYFYARSRQLGKEVRLVRRNLNSGTI